MQLGWIDFSPSDREKALGVLDLLSDHDQEHDPLGISSVERAFANFFFPGISTQLTRAKYFFLVPCQMIWLYEKSGGKDIEAINKKIAEMEKAYTKVLKNASENDTGIIGNNSCDGDGWVTRPPSSRYWTSLKEYKILKTGITISGYKKLVCEKIKKNKTDAHSEAEGEAGESKISTPGWKDYWDENLEVSYSEWYNSKPDENSDTEHSIKLTTNEGAFLKDRIRASHRGSLLAIILDNKTSFSKFADLKKGFAGLKGFIEQNFVDKEIKERYNLALAFSDFIIVARTLYNIIINEGKPVNEGKPDEDKPSGEESMSACANIDIDDLLKKAGISDDWLKKFLENPKEAMQKGNIGEMKELIIEPEEDVMGVLLEKAGISDNKLKEFLKGLQEAMQDGNIGEMKELIENREKEVVGVACAKTAKAGEIEKKWYGGKELEYRFNVAKNIINDIFESEGNENAGSEK